MIIRAVLSQNLHCYDHVDCYNYMNIHDYLKLCKHGYSKVTDHTCREIDIITRDQGILLIKKHEEKQAEYFDLFANGWE